MRSFAIAGLTAALMLSACGDEAEVPREEGSATEAEGDVLGGSISDDMLPLDSLRSQSPPLREARTNGGGDAPADESASEPEPEAAPPPVEAAETAPAQAEDE